jgi:hypothetical protein
MTNATSSNREHLSMLMAALVATNTMGFGAAKKLLNNTYGAKPGRPFSIENRDRLLAEFRKAEREASEYGNMVLSQIMLSDGIKRLREADQDSE